MNMLPLSSWSKNKARNQHETDTKQSLISCLAYSSNLKIETTCSSEMSVDFQRTKRRYFPEDRTLYNGPYENLESYRLRILCKDIMK
jgi:hypothetical protein